MDTQGMRSLCLAIALASPTLLRADDLDRQIRQLMVDRKIPSVSIAVVKDGKVTRLSSYGIANLEWHTKATPDTRYEIASITKMFTGAAVRLLVEKGKLRPEDEITRFFPDAPNSWQGVTVAQLINMTHGLADDWATDALPYGEEFIGPQNDAEMLQAFYRQKLASPVGTQFHYSSPAYTLLGMIVAKVGGTSFREFLNVNVLKPAGMSQSSLIDNSQVVPNRAEGYRVDEGQTVRGWFLGQYQHSRPCVGMISSARDMARWLIALEKGWVVKHPEELWKPSITSTGKHVDYSYGWNVETLLGHKKIHHGGQFRTGFRSTIAWFPEHRLGIAVLTNNDAAPVNRISFLVARTFIKSLPDPELEKAKKDSAPVATARLIAALKTLSSGTLDPDVFEANAFEPLSTDEAMEEAKSAVRWLFAGRSNLKHAMLMHGHKLNRYLTLRLVTKTGGYYLTFYYDDKGKVAYVEPTT